MAAASGLTAISAQSGWITVRNGDVLTCYVDGLAGDTSTPDWSTRWFELAGVTAAAVADAVWDEALSGHTTAGSVGKQLSDTALEATLTAIKGAGWTDETLAAIDVLIDAIKTKTDNLPAAPASAGEYTTNIGAIKAKTDNLPASPAAVGSAMTLTSAGVDAILDEVVVGTYTMRKLLKLAGTVLAGKLTGGGTNTISFEGLDGTAGVVVATVDGNGNRSSVTITV
jgi:hypothetical protein